MIVEALADDAFERDLAAHVIVDSEPHAIRVPEIELGKIPVQMLFGAVPINADHAALEDRIDSPPPRWW